MIILGIDPGTKRIGYGVIDFGSSVPASIGWGVLNIEAGRPHEKHLVELAEEFSRLTKRYQPSLVAFEKIFFFKNKKTIIPVAQAQGVLILEAQKHGYPIAQYSPLEIKMAVTGDGKADKKQVQKMVRLILNLDKIPQPDDAADALAIAICATQGNKNVKN